jgi:hypothetical protein
MYMVELSPSASNHKVSVPSTDPIRLVTQFYIPQNAQRFDEVKEALKRNVANQFLESITLLNERWYTAEELGVSSSKINQLLVPHRVKFNELFGQRFPGYTVVANADIFLDETIANVRSSDIHCSKKIFSLLRYEFTSPNLDECPLFGPRADSADTWIIHSNHHFPLNVFNFEMGRPGCDNKLNYLFRMLDYEVYNDPLFIRTYHCHKETERNYTVPTVQPPYMLSVPPGVSCEYQGYPVEELTEMFARYNMSGGNDRLFRYIERQLETETPFVVPRVAGIENNTAVHCFTSTAKLPEVVYGVLKNNAGLGLENEADLKTFAEWYMRSFAQSDMYASWEPWGHYIKHIKHSQQVVQRQFKRQQISTGVFDIFHFIAGGKPWTHALRGKKILIISPFGDAFHRQKQAYPIDLFPECTFVYLKPPMTQGTEKNRGFKIEFEEFCNNVQGCEFDVALCSCGGYGNPICAYIYSLGKSAIYVGGVLQMYFGVYGSRWIKERKDVLTLYMTSDWRRPNERPQGYEGIEQGCYW